MHMAAGLHHVQEGSVNACLEKTKNKRVRDPALHLALRPRPLSLLYLKSLNLAFLVHGLWLSRPLLQDFVLNFLHLFVYLSLCLYYYSMHCLRTFQLNETDTLFTSSMTESGMYVHVEMIRHGDRISLKLELGLICYLTIATSVFIRRLARILARNSLG